MGVVFAVECSIATRLEAFGSRSGTISANTFESLGGVSVRVFPKPRWRYGGSFDACKELETG
jgi:hypothetical protein